MCGRFTLTWDEWRRVAEAFRIDDDSDVAASYRPRFNIAPTDPHFIVTSEFERRRVQRARWGLVNRRATDNQSGLRRASRLLWRAALASGCPAAHPSCAG
jgi:putative SOS response-associated peptidase YedK